MEEMKKTYDRTAEDLGNIVNLGHVNLNITDQRIATHIHITGLGLTRDPFLNTGVRIMWVNVGMSQFHFRPTSSRTCFAARGPRHSRSGSAAGTAAGRQQHLPETKFSSVRATTASR